MPVERRARRLVVVTLAVPVIFAVYVAAFTGRLWSVVRPIVATMLGISVVGSVYVEEALRRTPAARVSPARAALVIALALVVSAASLPGASSTRAHSPKDAVIDVARAYLGTPYRLGAEGPNFVDCSGLLYRVFLEAGELPRIGGRRMIAVAYYGWFRTRGMISTDSTAGERGDLVYYKRENSHWKHIGIYLGEGKVLSALTNGVSIHGLHALQSKFVAFLKVNWSAGDADVDRPRNGNGDGNGNGNNGGGRDPRGNVNPGGNGGQDADGDQGGRGNQDDDRGQPDDEPTGGNDPDANLPVALAVGTMNLRVSADPNARIVGWVSRGSTFKVLGTGKSPSGALWYEVKLRSGKTGWVYSRWAQLES